MLILTIYDDWVVDKYLEGDFCKILGVPLPCAFILPFLIAFPGLIENTPELDPLKQIKIAL